MKYDLIESSCCSQGEQGPHGEPGEQGTRVCECFVTEVVK